jgi:chorismate-pyruvate lyase
MKSNERDEHNTMHTPKTNHRHVLLFLCAVALVVSAHSAMASGSYTARPPQPRAEQKALDRAKYSLGQRIFAGKVELTAHGDAAQQTERLKALQAQLPERVSKKKDLPAWAGKLNADQLDALEYYVDHRYAK